MNRVFYLITSFLLSGCASINVGNVYIINDDFEFRIDSFDGNTYTDSAYYANGKLRAIANYAFKKTKEKSIFNVGQYISFAENGSKTSEGQFSLGRYIQCCFSGPCYMFYSFKVGTWTYYYDDGLKLAQGNYSNSKIHIDTSCEGGDQVYDNSLDQNWTFWTKQGNETTPGDTLIVTLEALDYWQF